MLICKRKGVKDGRGKPGRRKEIDLIITNKKEMETKETLLIIFQEEMIIEG